ncbi:ABC transporter permease [Pasteurellaceae bacterium USgator11]|nr:ABC transporter permease [Pasteurellaceae bacterium UScroc12]TNG98211.1 ABC transporter permease [Pasteurellaceae bacterium USgator41]TNH00318.1 ABC transporter permease [Pasteurellaceae bacterium UScroc31]TNH01861.1 ABC transporter permease [Pasteurellaceae bacterium USgator11]
MNDVHMNLLNFSLVYLLLLVVLYVMKKSRIQQSKLLLIASIRMTVQLIIAGWLLTYIFGHPSPIFTILYVAAMVAFAIHRVLSKNPTLNKRFKSAVALSMMFSGLSIIAFFVVVVTNQQLFNPQYVIPLGGMIMGNAMTALNLGLKTFRESLAAERDKITVLLNFGAAPSKILLPYVNQALETALLPTLNSMLGMGIIALPGMMTGQILSGTLPSTAVLYQIAIMIAICTTVSLALYGALYFGHRTLYNQRNQLNFNG